MKRCIISTTFNDRLITFNNFVALQHKDTQLICLLKNTHYVKYYDTALDAQEAFDIASVKEFVLDSRLFVIPGVMINADAITGAYIVPPSAEKQHYTAVILCNQHKFTKDTDDENYLETLANFMNGDNE